MGGLRRFLTVTVFACLCATAAARAQSSQTEIYGPTYSLQQMRRIDIGGLHFGMTEVEVARVMAARGFHFSNPSNVVGAGFYASTDGRATITLGYTERGERIVDTIMYDRRLSANEAADIETRRAELLSMLGRPTHWHQWVKDDGEIGDRLLYLPRLDLVDDYDLASKCYVDWQCQSVLFSRDCRPAVSRVRSGVIDAFFGWRSLFVWADDYTQRSADLRRDSAFRALDTSGAVCAVMPIH